MKVEVDVLGFPSLISLMASVDKKYHETEKHPQMLELGCYVKNEVDVLGNIGRISVQSSGAA